MGRIAIARGVADALTSSNTGGDYNWGNLQFPSTLSTSGFHELSDIPIVLHFKADPYENLMRNRTGSGTGQFARITLPLPHNLVTDNKGNYTTATTETGGMWDSWGPWWDEMKNTWMGVTNIIGDITGWNAMEGERPMDLRDATYRGHALRDHVYSWTLIPKNKSDGAMIATIAKAFQTLSYPQVSPDSSYSRIIHPPLWDIQAWNLRSGGSEDAPEWSNAPKKSVLQAVEIQTSGAGGVQGIYAVDGGYPAVTKLSLSFKELEGLINTGKELEQRSEARMKGQ
tara:strand:+ start:271 stop:1122 length:852 start_codon:yes stop_codon:yes gene_type:complete